jgi:hypothetical protein
MEATDMKGLIKLSVVAALGAFVPHIVAATGSKVPEWFHGYWQMTADEDGGPLGEMMEFREDGTYVWHDSHCRGLSPLPFHIYDGDIYVTNMIPDKGPVSVIFHPSADHQRLSFTSPRTKNNAYYRHLTGNPCTR